MNIQQQISDDTKSAMREKDAVKLTVLRGLSSAISNKVIDLRQSEQELLEEDVIKIVGSEAKKRRDAIEAFNKGDRGDLAEKEEAELRILESYLPKQKSESEIEQVVDEVLSSIDEVDKNMGQVMRAVMERLGAGVDGKVVSKIVGSKLNG